MVNFRVLGLLAYFLLTAMDSALAQPPRRPPGVRDPFYEALIEVHQESPNKELFDLLNHASIRSEIKLGDEDALKIQENIGGAIRQIIALREQSRGQNKTKDDLKAEIHAAVAPFDESTYELLRKQADFDRLLGIYVQARSYRAALNEQVAAKIDLSGEQLTKYRDARSKAWRKIMEETREEIEKEIRNRDPNEGDPSPAIVKYFEQAEQKLDAKLREELTPAQRAKLVQLKGDSFALPERLFEFPGRRGRGRGRGEDRDERPKDPKRPDCEQCARNSKAQLAYF